MHRQRRVAQRAVAQRADLRLVVAVLARAAHDGEVRLEQRLARDDARAEVAAALAAVRVPVLDVGAAVGALGAAAGGVRRRVAGEDGEGELGDGGLLGLRQRQRLEQQDSKGRGGGKNTRKSTSI